MYGDGRRSSLRPERVNLIGEHTDYNLGFVLPGAIDKAIYVGVKTQRDGQKCRIHSVDYDQSIGNGSARRKPAQQWARYIYGVVQEMEKRGALIRPFDMTFGGGRPARRRTSSSAALEAQWASRSTRSTTSVFRANNWPKSAR